jgi:hypothetical protein
LWLKYEIFRTMAANTCLKINLPVNQKNEPKQTEDRSFVAIVSLRIVPFVQLAFTYKIYDTAVPAL